MTKQELATQVAQRTGLSQKEATAAIEAVTTTVIEAVSAGRGVYLRGFGTFKSATRAERKARNISKNNEIIIPAHSVPVFRPSKEFKERVKKQ